MFKSTCKDYLLRKPKIVLVAGVSLFVNGSDDRIYFDRVLQEIYYLWLWMEGMTGWCWNSQSVNNSCSSKSISIEEKDRTTDCSSVSIRQAQSPRGTEWQSDRFNPKCWIITTYFIRVKLFRELRILIATRWLGVCLVACACVVFSIIWQIATKKTSFWSFNFDRGSEFYSEKKVLLRRCSKKKKIACGTLNRVIR